MLRRLLTCLLAAWAAFAILNPALGAEPMFPAGLRIGLEPQLDLKLSTHSPGFEDIERKVAVTILDLPGRAYDEIERAVFAKNQRGLTDLKREDFSFRGGAGILVSGRAQDKGVTLHKWFLLAKADGDKVKDLTVLINVDVPDAARAVYSDAVIRKLLASVTFRPMPVQEQLGLLPFKIDELAGFRVIKVLGAGGVLLTDGPSDDITKQPYMIVSVGRGSPNEPGDRSKFARELLSSAPLRDISVTSSEAMRINSWPGYEIRAEAKAENGDPISLVQWVRFGTGGFLHIIGVAHKDEWDKLFTRFRAVRDGVDSR